MALVNRQEALKTTLDKFDIKELKTEQRNILECLLENRDCMAVLPTGYGKSLPFQVYVPLKREIDSTFDGKVLVCCPLISLMTDQVDKLSGIPGIAAAFIGASTESDQAIKDGKVDIIYASPEILVGDPEWRSNLQKFNVSLIVVDEFHLIATWGEDDSGKKAFREWFHHIGELRSLHPNASFLALTATCTLKIRKRVKKVLNLTDEVDICINPNKPNIKFVVSKIPKSMEESMCWLVDGLTTDTCPRTIIFCKSMSDTAKLYNLLTTELPDKSQEIEMFHSMTPSDKKQTILDALKDDNSNVKVVIATTALGMGVDIRNINSVVIFGLPDSLVDLLQEVGRVGRDGSPSVAIVIYHCYHLARAKKEIKMAIGLKQCRRLSFLTPFLQDDQVEEVKSTTGSHNCCDLCAAECACGTCMSLPLERLFQGLGEMDSEEEEMDNEEDSNESTDGEHDEHDEEMHGACGDVSDILDDNFDEERGLF